MSETPNVTVTLQKYPAYNWAPSYYKRNGPAYLDKVVINAVTEDATRMALEQAGQIDVVYAPIISQLSQFSQPQYYVVRAPRGDPRSLVLNTSTFPFNNALVREAVAYAIDKNAIVQQAYGGYGSAANNVITPNLGDYSKAVAAQWPKYDPAMAKKLLAQAGATPGSNGILHSGASRFRSRTNPSPERAATSKIRSSSPTSRRLACR